MTCREICKDYHAPPRKGRRSRYLEGQKYCKKCDIFIIYEGIFCPCCNTKLRTRSRKPALMIPEDRYI